MNAEWRAIDLGDKFVRLTGSWMNRKNGLTGLESNRENELNERRANFLKFSIEFEFS
jgi:hypothetical protein